MRLFAFFLNVRVTLLYVVLFVVIIVAVAVPVAVVVAAAAAITGCRDSVIAAEKGNQCRPSNRLYSREEKEDDEDEYEDEYEDCCFRCCSCCPLVVCRQMAVSCAAPRRQ